MRGYGFDIFSGGPITYSAQTKGKIAGEEIWSSIADFLKYAKDGETLLFYFSGHGIFYPDDDELYLATPNTDANDPSKGGIKLSLLLNRIRQSPSRNILAIIDACYSGTASPLGEEDYVGRAKNRTTELAQEKLTSELKDKNIHLLLSSRSYQPSEASGTENSLFTKFIIAGFQGLIPSAGSPGSVEENGAITPQSLFSYARHKVSVESEQRQLPDYKYIGQQITLHLHDEKTWGKFAQERDNALRQAEVEPITKIPELAEYYNVNQKAVVPDTRKQTLAALRSWIAKWGGGLKSNSQKVLLITGPPKIGKSWFTYELVKIMLESNYEVLKVEGPQVMKYSSTTEGKKGTIFILDDLYIRREGLYNRGISIQKVRELIESIANSKRTLGPLIFSVRMDTWSMIMGGCGLDSSIEDELILKVDLEVMESKEAVGKVVESFLVDSGNHDKEQQRLLGNIAASSQTNEKIIAKFGHDLLNINLFLERLASVGNVIGDNVSINDIIEDAIPFPSLSELDQIFSYYLSPAEADIDKDAEVLSLLYLVSQFQPVSIGSIREMWREKWVKDSTLLPPEFYKYLNALFSSKRFSIKHNLPLLNRTFFGGIYYRHNAIREEAITLVTDPQRSIEKVLAEYKRGGLTNRERDYLGNIENLIDIIKRYQPSIEARALGIVSKYPDHVSTWVNARIDEWKKGEAPGAMNPPEDPALANSGCGCHKKKKVVVRGIDAYHFLSLFKQFMEIDGKFDKIKYDKSGFAEAYKMVDIDLTGEDPEIIAAITRMLYAIFEKASRDSNSDLGGIIGYKGQLLYQFGAYETDLDLMLEDYFSGDLNKDPHCRNEEEKMLLLRRVGLDLMTIGRLNEAENLYERSYKVALLLGKSGSFDAAKVLQLKSELYIHQGRLRNSIDAANQAIMLYMEQLRGETDSSTGQPVYYCSTGDEMWGVQNIAMGQIQLIICSLAYQAWALHISGQDEFADITFQEAERLARMINPEERKENPNYPNRPPPMHHLRDLWGIYYADFLASKGDKDSLELARIVTRENLQYAECNELAEIISQCNRVLGDIEAILGENEYQSSKDKIKAGNFYQKAKEYYDRALVSAEKTTHHAIWLEILHSLGMWHIRQGTLSADNADYEKAISRLRGDAYGRKNLAYTKDYVISHIDLQIALAKAYLPIDKEEARGLATEAYNASRFLANDKNVDESESADPSFYFLGISNSDKVREQCS